MTAGAVDEAKAQSYTVTVVMLWIAEEASTPHPEAVKEISTHFFCPITGVV
jgi:hypothetical protein